MNLPQTSIHVSSLSQQPIKPALDEASNSVLQSSSSLKQGRWSESDSLRFVVFVHKYQEIFISKHQRRSCKIFKHFSEYLTKRTASQCRSHFQKLMLKHKTIAKLKKLYRGKFGDEAYQAELARLEEYTGNKNRQIDGVAEVARKEIGIQTELEQQKRCLGYPSGGANFPIIYVMNGLALLTFPSQRWTSCSCSLHCQCF